MTSAAAHLASLLIAATGLAPASAPGVWPLDPQPAVVNGFDPPASRYGRGHRGVDLDGSPGQEVHAAASGRVTYAGSLAGRGVVVVNHGTTRTTYQPVRAAVEVGALVTAGDVLGTLEAVGSHCAPRTCLHWGLIEGETYLDPLTLVGAGPVRLLPLFGPAAPSSGVPAQSAGVAPVVPAAGTTGTASDDGPDVPSDVEWPFTAGSGSRPGGDAREAALGSHRPQPTGPVPR